MLLSLPPTFVYAFAVDLADQFPICATDAMGTQREYPCVDKALNSVSEAVERKTAVALDQADTALSVASCVLFLALDTDQLLTQISS